MRSSRATWDHNEQHRTTSTRKDARIHCLPLSKLHEIAFFHAPVSVCKIRKIWARVYSPKKPLDRRRKLERIPFWIWGSERRMKNSLSLSLYTPLIVRTSSSDRKRKMDDHKELLRKDKSPNLLHLFANYRNSAFFWHRRTMRAKIPIDIFNPKWGYFEKKSFTTKSEHVLDV